MRAERIQTAVRKPAASFTVLCFDQKGPLLMMARTFLNDLIGLGLLPFSSAGTGMAENLVEQVQQELTREPLHFLVDRDGELTLADWEPGFDRFTAYDVAPSDLDLTGTKFSDLVWQNAAMRVEVYGFFADRREGVGEESADAEDCEDCAEVTVVRLVAAADGEALAALRAHLLVWFANDVTVE